MLSLPVGNRQLLVLMLPMRNAYGGRLMMQLHITESKWCRASVHSSIPARAALKSSRQMQPNTCQCMVRVPAFLLQYLAHVACPQG